MPTKKSAKKGTKKKAATGKRELIDTGRDKSYIKRDDKGQFKESDDVSRPLAADIRKKAKTGRNSRNSILAALPKAEYQRLIPHLKDVSLNKGQVLHASDTPAEDVYFLEEGVASLSVSSEKGEKLQLSIVGNESVVGERAIFKEGVFIIRCGMLTEGSGRSMRPEVFHKEFDRGDALHDLVLGRIEAGITETAQTALCNQIHP